MEVHSPQKYLRGMSAIEVVIGVSIAALILIFASNAIAQFVSSGRTIADKTEALYLAEEGQEFMRFIRDNSWTTVSGLTDGTMYYFSTSTTIDVTTVPETIQNFKRSVVVTNVYRDLTSNDIVSSSTPGSAVDPNTRYVTVTVGWGVPTTTISLTSILANPNP